MPWPTGLKDGQVTSPSTDTSSVSVRTADLRHIVVNNNNVALSEELSITDDYIAMLVTVFLQPVQTY
jgi:hypothetical protein